jgi:cyclophilin family peptidyl-prolyl cis-trans isomerase
MAKTNSPNSANSQFFINLNDSNAAILDSNFSVFGQVINGMDNVDAISHVPFTPNTQPQPDGQPLSDVTVVSVGFVS